MTARKIVVQHWGGNAILANDVSAAAQQRALREPGCGTLLNLFSRLIDHFSRHGPQVVTSVAAKQRKYTR